MARTNKRAMTEAGTKLVEERLGRTDEWTAKLVGRFLEEFKGFQFKDGLPQELDAYVGALADAVEAFPLELRDALLGCPAASFHKYFAARHRQEVALRAAVLREKPGTVPELTKGLGAAVKVLLEAAQAGRIALSDEIVHAFGGKGSTAESIVQKLRKHGFEIQSDAEAAKRGWIAKPGNRKGYHLGRLPSAWTVRGSGSGAR